MGWYPHAVRKEIKPGSNDPTIDPWGLILHVTAGRGSPYEYFRDASGGIESHFCVMRSGVVEQYRSTGREADANLKANSFYAGGHRRGFLSIETEGLGGGRWNKAQRDALAELIAWAATSYDIPLRICPGPFSRGVGHHTMWGAPGPWTPVAKSCPGPLRKLQFAAVLRQARKAAGRQDDDKPDPLDTYTVQPGDTLAGIARACATTVDALVRLNGIEDPDHIIPGQTLRVPKTTRRRKPTLHLDDIVRAARRDPDAPQGHTVHPKQVRYVERALVSEGLLAPKWVDGSFGTCTVDAYAGWQRSLGYSGADANGVPGETSLRRLGRKYDFKVVA